MSSDTSWDEFTESSKKSYFQKENQKTPSNVAFSKENFGTKRFNCDKDVPRFIEDFQNKTKENYFKRDSKSKFDGYIKNQERINANPKLTKRYIKFMCIHGPDYRPSSSTGERQSSTTKMDCPAVIVFGLTENGKYYVITKMTQHKGHEILDKLRDFLPQNRKLSTEGKQLIREQDESKSSKLKLMGKLTADGKRTTLRDVSNYKYTIRQEKKKNDFGEALQILQKNGATYEVKYDQDKCFEGLFFFTKYMQYTMDAWPEFLLIDSTYQLLQLQYPIVIIVAVDGNGATEIIAFAIVTHETEETFQWIIDSLKKHNPSACTRIKSFMADKDMTARKVIEETFKIKCYICCFHVLQRFRRVVLSPDLVISKEKKNECLALLEELRYAITEEQYNIKYDNFCKTAPKVIVDYYNENWHDIRKDWVKCYMTVFNFCNETNNRLENLNQKLKLMLEKNSFLTDFMEDLFIFFRTHTNQRDSLAVLMFSKRPRARFTKDQYKYLSLLTMYASGKVLKEMEKMSHVKYITATSDAFLVRSASTEQVKYTVTLTSCNCIDFRSMGLPCRHILKIRQTQNVLLYDATLCSERWTKEYFRDQHRLFKGECTKDSPAAKTISSSPNVEVLPEVQSITCSLSRHTKKQMSNLKSGDCRADKTISPSQNVIVLPEVQSITATLPRHTEKEMINSQNGEADNENVSCLATGTTVVVTSGNVLSEIQPTSIPTKQVESCNGHIAVIESPCKTTCQPTNAMSCKNESSNAPQSDCNSNIPNPTDVILEPLRKRKGRPKGSKLKAVGLLKKQRLHNCKKFKDMSDFEKATVLFTCILKYDVLQDKPLGLHLITYNDLIDMSHQVPCWLYDKMVDLQVLQQFMEFDAYQKLCIVVEEKKEDVKWICAVCKLDLNIARSIFCDQCLLWMHLKCINLKRVPSGDFYCATCISR